MSKKISERRALAEAKSRVRRTASQMGFAAWTREHPMAAITASLTAGLTAGGSELLAKKTANLGALILKVLTQKKR